MAKLPKTIASKYIYNGKIFNLRRDEILHFGKRAAREIVEHPGGAAVLAARDGFVYLVRQYRHPYRCYILEVPAGKVEKGEAPRETALRELAEETGIIAAGLEEAGTIYPSPGYTDEVIHLFYTDNFTATPESRPDSDEFLEAAKYPVAEVYNLVDAGKITDAKTLVLLYMYRSRLLE